MLLCYVMLTSIQPLQSFSRTYLAYRQIASTKRYQITRPLSTHKWKKIIRRNSQSYRRQQSCRLLKTKQTAFRWLSEYMWFQTRLKWGNTLGVSTVWGDLFQTSRGLSFSEKIASLSSKEQSQQRQSGATHPDEFLLLVNFHRFLSWRVSAAVGSLTCVCRLPTGRCFVLLFFLTQK